MPDIIYQGVTLNGTNNSDVLVGSDLFAAANTINGGGGDDLIYGDMRNAYVGPGGASLAAAVSLQDPFGFGGSLWSLSENADIADSTTIPHATAFLNGMGDQVWFALDLQAGQELRVDLDYGFGDGIGTDFDSFISLRDAANMTLVSNDDSSSTIGGFGSSPSNGGVLDSHLTYTAPDARTVYLLVQSLSLSQLQPDEFATVHFSLAGQAVAPVTAGDDLLRGGTGNDYIHGQGGADTVFGGADDDVIFGGTGDDWLSGDAGHDIIYGEGGRDQIIGGSGFDTAYGGNDGDRIRGGLGDDTFYGDNGADYLQGDAGNDMLFGGNASDILFGGTSADTMEGGDGRDFFRGDLGADVLTGGAGADVFIYRFYSDSKTNTSQRDTITDFEVGVDKIDLSNMDADRSVAGNQAFNFIGVAGFNGADSVGDVRWQAVGAGTMIAVDVNGDGVGDMLILLDDTLTLSANDFIL